MQVEIVSKLNTAQKTAWERLLQDVGLEADLNVEQTVLAWEDELLVATGSRLGNLLKCIAVEPTRQGNDLTATVLTALRQEAFKNGFDHLFLYTKPANAALFSSLFFYPIAQTDSVLLMENRQNGIASFLDTFPSVNAPGSVGAAVMNCNPFTYGHLHLIETASRECDHVYIFVLSEDRSRFSAADRLEMVRRGTAHLDNVTVLPTGPYLISSATFPTYFLKDREHADAIHCQLDVEIFLRYFVPRFSVTHRYVGTEPFSPMTEQYNSVLKALLPTAGIAVREVPRFEKNGVPVSASAVRRFLETGQTECAKSLTPQTTWDFF